MLAKDIKSYQDTIAAFGTPVLHERFEFIRQLGNIFLIPPDTLKSYIAENYLGRIDATLLRPYLAQRSDWGQLEKGFDGAPNGTDTNKEEAKGIRDRFGMGRLSMMMKDLEGVKLGESMNVGMPMLSASFAGNFSISTAFGRGDS